MQEYIDQLKEQGWKPSIITPRCVTMQLKDRVAKITKRGIVYRTVEDYQPSPVRQTERERIDW